MISPLFSLEIIAAVCAAAVLAQRRGQFVQAGKRVTRKHAEAANPVIL